MEDKETNIGVEATMILGKDLFRVETWPNHYEGTWVWQALGSVGGRILLQTGRAETAEEAEAEAKKTCEAWSKPGQGLFSQVSDNVFKYE